MKRRFSIDPEYKKILIGRQEAEKKIRFCDKCGEAYQTDKEHECTTYGTICRDLVLYLKIEIPKKVSKRELLGLITVNNDRIESTSKRVKEAVDKIEAKVNSLSPATIK